mgnify:CR=1 FL=1
MQEGTHHIIDCTHCNDPTSSERTDFIKSLGLYEEKQYYSL